MLYMIGSGGGVPLWEKTRLYLPKVGRLLTPGRNWHTPHCRYACDNGVYAAYQKKRYWDEDMEVDYFRMLDKLPKEKPPLFVILPDVVADWNATLALAQIYLPLLRDRGLPSAIALQDGCDFQEAMRLNTEAIFVGGSTEWKLANIENAVRYFKPVGRWVHIGRVNTAKRLSLCLRAGVDSCDGTGLNKHFDRMIQPLKNAYEKEKQARRLLTLDL